MVLQMRNLRLWEARDLPEVEGRVLSPCFSGLFADVTTQWGWGCGGSREPFVKLEKLPEEEASFFDQGSTGKDRAPVGPLRTPGTPPSVSRPPPRRWRKPCSL